MLYDGSKISWKLNRENIEKIIEGKTTEDEINFLFGDDYRKRLSFSPPLIKQYRKKKYDITGILFYSNPRINEKDAGATTENFKLSIFIKDGIVQFYFVNHIGDMGNGIW